MASKQKIIDGTLLRRKISQMIDRKAKESMGLLRSKYEAGYLAALARVVRLIDKLQPINEEAVKNVHEV